MGSIELLTLGLYQQYISMGVSVMNPIADIDDLLQLSAEQVVRITDPVVINEYSYKLAQYMIYLQQQHNLYEAIHRQLEHRAKILYAEKMSADGQVKMSVTEKKATVMRDPELVSIYDQINEVSTRAKLLDGLVDRCNELLNILKRVHDDLTRERKLTP